MNTKLEEVVAVLKNERHTEEQIEQILAEISKAAAVKFNAEMMANLTEEDLAAIDKCTVPEEANLMIREIFAKRSGKNADTVMDEIMTTFAEGFLNKYYEEKNKATQ
ncbi:MAG TPA: hypothetical protein VMW04_00855 [Patescibacteria group bacterium]|nr:hypothetical protein [Patescibacteria group bacterium]